MYKDHNAFREQSYYYTLVHEYDQLKQPLVHEYDQLKQPDIAHFQALTAPYHCTFTVRQVPPPS